MSFPRFDGTNPKIWKDKCMDYFTVFNLPAQSWVPTATMHFDDNAAKWLQVYKAQHPVSTWETFIAAVEQQFG